MEFNLTTETFLTLWETFKSQLFPATLETLFMVALTTIVSIIIGLPWGILTAITSEGHIAENKFINRLSNTIINIIYDFPQIILMIILIPRLMDIAGITIVSVAAVISLSIFAAPFAARLVEEAILKVDKGIVETSESLGANNFQIIIKVLIPESIPSLIQGLSLLMVNIVGLSNLIGILNGPGLVGLAMRFGFHKFRLDIIIYSALILIALVKTIQYICYALLKKLNNKYHLK